MSGRSGSSFIGSMPSSVSRGLRGAAVSPRRGRRVVSVPGVRHVNIMMWSSKPSQSGKFLSDKNYVKTFGGALSHAGKHSDIAILLAFDIDETLAESSGTGSRTQLAAEVLDALETVHGASSQMFIMATTGRTPEDAQIAFGNFQIPLVTKDGSWIRFPDSKVKEYAFPEAKEFEDLAKRILKKKEDGLDVIRLAELRPAIGLSFSRGEKERAAYNKYLGQFEGMAKARGGELAVYTHFYEHRIEIIIRNGVHTKATGIQKMMEWLKKNYNFSHVLLIGIFNLNLATFSRIISKLKLNPTLYSNFVNRHCAFSLPNLALLDSPLFSVRVIFC
jgi:hydroxymethylpyrimidine pyrophosphatase-like HAD family hydrolase